MQNSQLPCFTPCISLKPFPHLARSICHLSLLPAPTLHSPALLCLPHSLPSFAIIFSFVLYFKVLFLFFLRFQSHLFPLASRTLFSPLCLFFPLSPFLSLPLCISPQCENSTCDTLLPVSSHLNGMCGLAVSDSSRQEVRANLSPTSTPRLLLLFVLIIKKSS